MGELKKTFRPEFLNRVDDIIVFRQLTKEDIHEIARRMLTSLDKRLKDMDITVQVTDAAVEAIAAEGFDPVYGARPLRRAIQSRIEDPLAEKLLEGAFQAGDSVTVDYAEGVFRFDKPDAAPTRAARRRPAARTEKKDS